MTTETIQQKGYEVATLGAGCFWCVEAVYGRLDGVVSATSGYMGGGSADAHYHAVGNGDTGHAEVVQIVFDPKKITYEEILDWFWRLHDPTTLNRQGADVGRQYRSVIFYHSPEQEKIARASKDAAAPFFKRPVVTEITPASEFFPAENYHQDYYEHNADTGYCRFVIRPKLKKLHLDDKVPAGAE